MTNWPDKPLIRVVRGREYDEPVRDVLATRSRDDEYLLATGPRAGNSLSREASSDDIDDWEEVTAVPTSALRDLLEAWRGTGGENLKWLRNVEDAMDPVLSCLPADEPGTLDRAVTRVKDIDGVRMIDADSTQEERLSLLLDALASVQSAARKAAPLAMVARICADWANLENPRRDSLEAARERTKVLSDPGSFIVLSALVGDVTTALCDNFSPRHDLIDAGAYALAWAAQIIEEDDK